MAHCILRIALDTPLNSVFDYGWPHEEGATPQVGQLALVSFGRREVVGLIVAIVQETEVPPDKLKNAIAVRDQLPPLSPQWLALAGFAADYYQRPLGEVALPGLPSSYVQQAPQTDARFVFLAGEDNRCFLPEGQQRSAEFFARHRPGRDTLHRIRGYGHLDVFFGRDAWRDTHPLILEELAR